MSKRKKLIKCPIFSHSVWNYFYSYMRCRVLVSQITMYLICNSIVNGERNSFRCFFPLSFHLCVLIFHANVYESKVFLHERMRNAFTACALYVCNPSGGREKGVQVLQCNVYLSHKSKNKGKREEG